MFLVIGLRSLPLLHMFKGEWVRDDWPFPWPQSCAGDSEIARLRIARDALMHVYLDIAGTLLEECVVGPVAWGPADGQSPRHTNVQRAMGYPEDDPGIFAATAPPRNGSSCPLVKDDCHRIRLQSRHPPPLWMIPHKQGVYGDTKTVNRL